MRALPLGAKRERSRLLRRKSVVFAFAKDYFSAPHSPLPKKPNGFGNRAPKNRNEVRFLGRGGAERAGELCPSGQSESAADCSDERALFQRRGFGTRKKLLKNSRKKAPSGAFFDERDRRSVRCRHALFSEQSAAEPLLLFEQRLPAQVDGQDIAKQRAAYEHHIRNESRHYELQAVHVEIDVEHQR